jgi:hypothetical protein
VQLYVSLRTLSCPAPRTHVLTLGVMTMANNALGTTLRRYHPPIVPGGGTLHSPYANSDFWAQEWRRLCETDPVVQKLGTSI